jgi:hypothetical protein
MLKNERKKKKVQHKNDLNIFLNEYFSVILFIVAILIFVFSYFLLLGPKFKATTMVITDNIATQKKLYQEQEKRLNELKIINSVYSEILPTDLGKFNQVLPTNYIKESLFGELEEIVFNHGFTLGTVILEEAEEEEGSNPREALPSGGELESSNPTSGGELESSNPNIGKVRATIDVHSLDYVGFKRLLKSLESSSRLFDIETVDFSQAEGSMQAKIVTYYYKDKILK